MEAKITEKDFNCKSKGLYGLRVIMCHTSKAKGAFTIIPLKRRQLHIAVQRFPMGIGYVGGSNLISSDKNTETH